MKLYYLVAAALLSSTMVFGQRLGGNHNEEAGSVNNGVGIKAGVNVSSIYDAPSDLEAEGITSFHFGAYGKLGLSEKIALQLEAMYSRRGADFEYKVDGLADPVPLEYRFDYIDVPLLLVYDIIGENTLSVMAGPQASLMLTAKDGSKEVDKDPFHTFDMGGTAGLQFGYKFLRVGARYNVGFRDIINNEDAKMEPGFLLKEDNFRNHFGQFYVAFEL